MDEAEFRSTVRAVFAHSPSGSDSILDRVHYTNDGLLAIASESTGKVGFGVAAGLTATPEVLSTVDDLNRLMTFGHYWLAPGADSSNYSLICGFKFQYDAFTTEQVIELVVGLMQHGGVLAQAARRQLGDVPHREYWIEGVSPGAQALALTGHLG